jgi:hypothetical protein
MPDECPNFYFDPLITLGNRSTESFYVSDMRTFGMTNAAWGHNWMMNVLFWDAQWDADTF